MNKSFLRLVTQLQKIPFEIAITGLFFLAHNWIGSNKYYLILLIIYITALYIKTKDIKKTLWIGILATFPFQHGKYFTSLFTSYVYRDARPSPMIFYISYTDVLLVALLYVLWRDKIWTSRRITRSDLALFPLCILMGISTFFSTFFSSALFGFIQFVKLIIFYLLAKIFTTNESVRISSLAIFLLFVTYEATLIIAQYIRGAPIGLVSESLNKWSRFGLYAGEIPSLYRPAGITDDPNVTASILGIFIPMLFFINITKNNKKNLFSIILFIISCIALIFTASRAIWATTIIVCVGGFYAAKTWVHYSIPMRFKNIWMFCAGIFLLATSPLILTRLSSLTKAWSEFGSGTYRLTHLSIARDFVTSYPFGIGLNTMAYEMITKYQPLYYQYDPSELHNVFAQVLAALGIPGFVCFILFIILMISDHVECFYVSPISNRIISFSVLLSLISYLLIGNFYPWLLNIQVSGFFWILAGLYL